MAGIPDQEIKPYRIHVSSKYLDLTKRKLELTRLPHEVVRKTEAQDDSIVREDGNEEEEEEEEVVSEGQWRDGTPKSEIEPLVDFWLESYSWREREEGYNEDLPQFRTAIEIDGGDGEKLSPRIHFLHIKSPRSKAIPLLLIPSFPLTNLSLAPLFSALTSPSDPSSTPAFHLVVPSIPGLGFSDALGARASISPLKHTATIFNTLMTRLGYDFYLASATGSGRLSPANIDYQLPRLLGDQHPKHCLGIHAIDPPLARPSPTRQPLAWGKYAVARFFHANIWGYGPEDFVALRNSDKAAREREKRPPRNQLWSTQQKSGRGSGWVLGLREPDTLAYALCDSPVGLLSMTCSALRARNPRHGLDKMDIVHVAQLAWLPGPEAGMRFWAGAEGEVEDFRRGVGRGKREGGKTRAVVTVLRGGDGDGYAYVCPAWADEELQVVGTRRVSGGLGMVVWERGDVVVDGVRALVKELEGDKRLSQSAVDGTAVDAVIEGGREPVDVESAPGISAVSASDDFATGR